MQSCFGEVKGETTEENNPVSSLNSGPQAHCKIKKLFKGIIRELPRTVPNRSPGFLQLQVNGTKLSNKPANDSKET